MKRRGLILTFVLMMNMIFSNVSIQADEATVNEATYIYYDFDRLQNLEEPVSQGYRFGDDGVSLVGDVTENDAGFRFLGNGYVELGQDNYDIEDTFEIGFKLADIDRDTNNLSVLYRKGRYAYPILVQIQNGRMKFGIRAGGSVHYNYSNVVLEAATEYDIRIEYDHGQFTTYVDGVVDVDTMIEGALTFRESDATSVIGGDTTGNYNFVGSINDFYINNGQVVEQTPVDNDGIYYLNRGNIGEEPIVIGSPTMTEGVYGDAVQFEQDDSYLVLSESRYDITNAFTLAYWVKLNPDAPNGGRQTIYQRGTYVYPLSMYIENGRIESIIRTGGTNYLESSTVLSTGDWHSVVATFESGVYKLYIDGVLDMEATIGDVLSYDTRHEISTLGANNIGGSQLYGAIDNFKLLNMAVSEEDFDYLLSPSDIMIDRTGDSSGDLEDPTDPDEPTDPEVPPVIIDPLPAGEPAAYFIDYENGNDSNSGLEQSLAWKHCPGDNNAIGLAGAHTIVPGDAFVFRGGVEYLGEIDIRSSGTEDLPILYIGDGWGSEKAIISGSDLIAQTPIQCTSPEEAEGSPLYDDLYYLELDGDVDPLSMITENGEMFYFSVAPFYEDLFWFRDYDKMIPIPEEDTNYEPLETSFRNDIDFITEDESYYDNTLIMLRVADNRIGYARTTGFDPSINTLYYSGLGQTPTYDSSDNCYYALMNHIDYVDQPGEQYYNPDTNRLYFYPMVSNPESAEYRLSTRHTAFEVYGASNVEVGGFEIKEFAGLEDEIGFGTALYSRIGGSENLVYRDNDIHTMRCLRGSGIVGGGRVNGLLIEGNTVSECQRGSGIHVSGENIIINDNRLYKVGRTGMLFTGISNSSITNNYISDIYDVHGNGMALYRAGTDTSHDVLVANNTILNTYQSFTCHGRHPDATPMANNYVLYGNKFVSEVSSGVVSWGASANELYFFDNIFISYGEKGVGIQSSSSDFNVTAAGNILSGFSAPIGADDVPNDTHDNLYVKLAHYQAERYGWTPNPGEITMAPEEVFVNYGDNDLELRDGITLPDSGIDIDDYIMTNEDGYMILRP